MSIEVSRLAKSYGTQRAVDDVSFRVGKGEIVGFLGPNGAGKSTLVKVLMTLVRPDTCEGHLLGSRIGHPKALKRTGYLPENAAWPAHLTAREILALAGSLRGISRRTRLQQCDELLALTGLTPWENDRPAVFSKGCRPSSAGRAARTRKASACRFESSASSSALPLA